MSNCTCAVPGFIDVACPVAHDEFLPAKCPCGAVWPPAAWDAQRYPPCGGCGRVCITCCECAHNLAPDAPPCAVCGHGMPCQESCCATDHRVTGFRVHNECDAPEQDAIARAEELAALRAQMAREDAEYEASRQASREAQEFLDRHAHLLADIGLDDASANTTFDRVAHAVGPATMARASVALSAHRGEEYLALDPWHGALHVPLADDYHGTRMVPSPYASTMPNRAARRQHDRDVRRNRVGNSRGRR